jgi:transposase
MGYAKRKTARREHDTPRRVRFHCLIEQGYSQSEAAKRAKVPRTTAIKWLKQRPSDRRTGKARPGRHPIISDTKVKEMVEWMTGHFNRRAMPLQEIARLHGIKACNDTILAAFARHGYHHHVPDCKPFLSEHAKRKRYAFSIANWDRPKEYWRKGFYYDETTIQSNMRRRVKSYAKEENDEGSIVFNSSLQAAGPLYTVQRRLGIILRAGLYFYRRKEKGKALHKGNMRHKSYEGY